MVSGWKTQVGCRADIYLFLFFYLQSSSLGVQENSIALPTRQSYTSLGSGSCLEWVFLRNTTEVESLGPKPALLKLNLVLSINTLLHDPQLHLHCQMNWRESWWPCFERGGCSLVSELSTSYFHLVFFFAIPRYLELTLSKGKLMLVQFNYQSLMGA